MNNFHINPDIYTLFGGKKQTKKAKPKKKVKAKRRTDYSQSKLNKVNKIKVETDSIVDDIQSSITQYKNSIDFSQNKSRDSDCDEFTTNDNSVDYHSPGLLNHSYSTSTSNNSFGDLFLDTQSRASDSDIDTSPLFEYNYTFEDLNICGAINMPKLDLNESPIKPNTTMGLNTIDAINTPKLNGNSMDKGNVCSDIEDTITPTQHTQFTYENIGPMGAITTSSFTANRQESAINDIYSDDEQDTIKFMHNRSLQISADLNDLMEQIDEDIDSVELESIPYLLEVCGIRDNMIYKFFDQILHVNYLYEVLNMDPYNIIRPSVEFSVTQLLKLNKFVQIVVNKISDNPTVNNSTYNNKWITINDNQYHHFHQTPSPVLINHKSYGKQIVNDENEMIKLNSDAQFSATFECEQQKQTYKLSVIKLPECCPHQPSLIEFGIEIDNQSIYIDDRLSIYYNEEFISNIGHGQFLENNDNIIIKIDTSSKYCEISIVSVSHENIQIEMNKPFKFVNVFVKQWNGNGIYNLKML